MIMAHKSHTLKTDRLELVVFPDLGCYWKTLRLSHDGYWMDLLKPLSDDGPPYRYGSYMMAPWSNRIVDGVFEFEGKRHQLHKNFPDDTAIHGDVRTRPWNVREATGTRFEAVLDSAQFEDFNFPFRLRFHHLLEISGANLRMSLFIENTDRIHAPVGLGFHPFFMRKLTDLDSDVIVVLPAEKVYPDRKCIPTGPAADVSDGADLRREKPLGNPNLDHCFTGLTGNVVRLVYTGSKVEVRYQVDSIFSHIVIYAPSDKEGRAEDFVAVEPVTHVTNGFNFLAQGWQETGVHLLEPGRKWGGTCTLSVSKLNPKV